MNKKGQAAMEFLMTYGWAILAAVIVIGVLAAFGVFNPGAFIPNSCIISAPLGCNAGTADTAGIQLEVRNGAGESVDISNIEVVGCPDTTIGWVDSAGSGTIDTVAGTIYPMPDQELTVFTLDACTPTAGKFQGDITVTYSKTGSALNLTSTGKLIDEV